MWSLQLVQERPDVNVTALDLSEALFPPDYTVPSNVTFRLWNIFDPVPAEYRGRFDVVHLRLILAASWQKDIGLVVDHMMEMLSKSHFFPMIIDVES